MLDLQGPINIKSSMLIQIVNKMYLPILEWIAFRSILLSINVFTVLLLDHLYALFSGCGVEIE